jgi:predicted TPR repeat methyltransferase
VSDPAIGHDGLRSGSQAPPSEVVELYDAWAQAQYDADLDSWGYDAPERIASIVAAHLASWPHDVRVLDAGCGTGRVGAALNALGVNNVIGGDFSEASLEVARARHVYDDVSCLDLNAPLPFADATFAAIASVGVFSYLVDSATTVAEMLRIAMPGGIVVFTQRTDLWVERHFDALLDALSASGACSAKVSDPVLYLPGHPEFRDEVLVIDTVLTKPPA